MPSAKKGTVKEGTLTLDHLKGNDWKFKNHATCDRCGEDIEWWLSPQNTSVPFNSMPRGVSLAVKHWYSCGKDI